MKWIKCSEQMPEEGRTVLICGRDSKQVKPWISLVTKTKDIIKRDIFRSNDEVYPISDVNYWLMIIDIPEDV